MDVRLLTLFQQQATSMTVRRGRGVEGNPALPSVNGATRPARRPYRLVQSYFDLVISDFVEHQDDGLIDGGLIVSLHRATHATLYALAADLAELGLTSSQINVLAVLADGRSRSVGELATGTATRPTTLTSVLDRLVDKGYVVRDLDPADRRSFVVWLTDDGGQAAAAVAAAVHGLERSALAGISESQLAGFRAVLDALTEAGR